MTHPTIRVRANGPLVVTSDVVLIDEAGNQVSIEGADYVLCRCGRTDNAPFCDRSHAADDGHGPGDG